MGSRDYCQQNGREDKYKYQEWMSEKLSRTCGRKMFQADAFRSGDSKQ